MKKYEKYAKFAEYDGIPLDSLKVIGECSSYNSNYYVGLKRKSCAHSDLIYALSDDDNVTTLYILRNFQFQLFAECYSSEGDIIRVEG